MALKPKRQVAVQELLKPQLTFTSRAKSRKICKSVSSTYEYRKFTKPMLERNRRARINKLLEELKELLSDATQLDCGKFSKFEKADILEFALRHLQQEQQQSLRSNRENPISDRNVIIYKYWAGFQCCLCEVTKFLQSNNNIDFQLISKQNNSHNLWRPW